MYHIDGFCMQAKGYLGGNLVQLLTHNALIVHTGPVYRMTAVVVMLAASKEPVVRPQGSQLEL